MSIRAQRLFFSLKNVHYTQKIDLEKLKASLEKPTPEQGLFVSKSANDWIEEAKTRPIPKMLFGQMWYENELSILFADTNLGKSILAVQIANSISKGEAINGFQLEAEKQAVLYFDFELSDKQFEARYSELNNKEYINHYLFDSGFNRAEINPDTDFEGDFEKQLTKDLEKTISQSNIKIVIIDNITYLRNGTETAKDALPLMKQLKNLKNKYQLSILVLAHTPKRDLSKPITRNDLQGSKMIINFCDSCFSIGESSRDKSIRYLKQIKQRNSQQIYDAENVAVCEIAKPYNFLQFQFLNFGTEREHLKLQTENDISKINDEVVRLRTENRSYREIATELNISKSKVERILKKSVPSVPPVPCVYTVGQVGQVGQRDGNIQNADTQSNNVNLPF